MNIVKVAGRGKIKELIRLLDQGVNVDIDSSDWVSYWYIICIPLNFQTYQHMKVIVIITIY